MDNQVLEVLRRRVSLRTYDSRPVTEEEKAVSLKNARHYVEEGKKYASFFRKEN